MKKCGADLAHNVRLSTSLPAKEPANCAAEVLGITRSETL